ncbi:hypothetical protein IT774_03445 [Salinimonas marina]|uniref:Uncharacterized protein n=1 Tax=Salinimonas marina TaxID=2785918 RepID=A0A7S9HE47_9ALTE|nr:hypothetical protein [Salinimonas marina]QPG06271.1 hypothetical protein IT774_03445 [Salinimonas marina]
MLFLTVLFVIVVVLFAYALSSDKGKNTIYARRHAPSPPSMTDMSKKPSTKVVSINS